jgi:hypothetical protein
MEACRARGGDFDGWRRRKIFSLTVEMRLGCASKGQLRMSKEDDRMKYLCQVWFDGTLLDAMSPEEKATLDGNSLGYDKDLVASGHMILAEALQSPRSAMTVRVRNGEMSVTDGPFIETKEALGGFILIEAKDLNEAIRIAAGIPLAKLGAIEVRPIHEFG